MTSQPKMSLFALEEFVGAPTRGARRPRSTATRRPRPAARPAPKPGPTARAAAFDTGAPIRCEHAVPYTAVPPVAVPRDPDLDAARSLSAGEVEAFEDDASDVIEMPAVETGDVADEEEESPVAVSRLAGRNPRMAGSLDLHMAEVERDLASLAARSTPPPPVAEPSPAEPSGGESPAPASPRPQGHAIFDAMAKGMSQATEFRLPPMQLSQVFSALDRTLDAETAAPALGPAPVPVPGRERATGGLGVEAMLRDLAEIRAARPGTRSADPGAEAGPAEARAAAAIDIRHDVPLVPQQTGLSCWAAGAAMLVAWRDRQSVDPSEIAAAAGYWAQYRNGLDAEDTGMFRVWGLTPEPAQSYTVEAFADLLRNHGPLWVASAEPPGPHIRVVTGMVGDGTPAGTLVSVNDPWESGMTSFRLPNRGSSYDETYQRFVEKQEQLARQEIKLQGIYVAHC